MDLSNDRSYSMYDFIFINQLDWTCYHMIDLFGSISYFKKLLPRLFTHITTLRYMGYVTYGIRATVETLGPNWAQKSPTCFTLELHVY